MLAVNTLGTGIRFRPTGFLGDMMMHCHISQHADYGSIQIFRVTDDADVCEAIRKQNGWSKEMLYDGILPHSATFDVEAASSSSISINITVLEILIALGSLLVAGGVIYFVRRHRKQSGHRQLEELHISYYETTRTRPDELELR